MKIMYSKRKQCCTLRFVFFVFFYGCFTVVLPRSRFTSLSLSSSPGLFVHPGPQAPLPLVSAGQTVQLAARWRSSGDNIYPPQCTSKGTYCQSEGPRGACVLMNHRREQTRRDCVFFHLSGLGKGRTRLACAGAVGFPVGLNIQVASLISTRFPQGAWC